MMQHGGLFMDATFADLMNRVRHGTRGTSTVGKILDAIQDNIKSNISNKPNQSGSGVRRRRISRKKPKRVAKKRIAKKNGVYSRRVL